MSTLSSVPEEREQEDIEIREKLVALLLMNQRDPDGIDEYYEFCVRDMKQVINQQIKSVLDELEDKKKVCDTFHCFGVTKRIDAVPLSTIQKIRSRYE